VETQHLKHRDDLSLPEIMKELQRQVITQTLEALDWNQTKAAKRLRVPLSTLNQQIRRLGIQKQPLINVEMPKGGDECSNV
jgi:transcriptional regulator with GAF, ATPase, and Fis domain